MIIRYLCETYSFKFSPTSFLSFKIDSISKGHEIGAVGSRYYPDLVMLHQNRPANDRHVFRLI